ncbi:MAG TPA: hypothetical protein PKE04_13715, partial [Clostridia bacterium]|nr:hypothetical protein [Clostridia bacterium]
SLLEVLRFFRDNDMNGDGDAANEIPLGVRDVGAVYVTLASSWGLGKQMGYQINIMDDKVDVWLDNDEYRAYLEYMHQLYEEGLLWSDYFKGDLPAWRSNLSNGLYGAFFMPFSDVFLAREMDYVGFEPITGPYGDKAWNDNGSTAAVIGAFAVSADTKYPELALRWVDYFYSEEGALLFRFGVEGETYYFNEAGLPTFNDSILNDSRGFMTAYGDLSLVPGIGTGAPHWLNDVNNASR